MWVGVNDSLEFVFPMDLNQSPKKNPLHEATKIAREGVVSDLQTEVKGLQKEPGLQESGLEASRPVRLEFPETVSALCAQLDSKKYKRHSVSDWP